MSDQITGNIGASPVAAASSAGAVTGVPIAEKKSSSSGKKSAAVGSPAGVGKVKAKTGISKVRKPSSATAPSHPPTQQMVDASIKNLKERGGSSLLAIKKYISATYKCDAQKLAPFIKKYLKSAVANGKLIQTKGKGASGSFKLSAAATKEPKVKTTAKTVKSKSSVAASKGSKTGEKKVKKIGSGKKSTTVGKKSTGAKKLAGTEKKVIKKSLSAAGKGKKINVEKQKAEKAKAKTAKSSGTVKAKSSAKVGKPTSSKSGAKSAVATKVKKSTTTTAKKVASASGKKKTAVAAKK